MACPNHPSIDQWLQPCSRCATEYCSNCLVLIAGANVCGRCKGEAVRDVRSGVSAQPTGELASILLRFGAVFIDNIILSIPVYAIACAWGMMMGVSGEEPSQGAMLGFQAVFTIFGLIAWTAYEGLMLSRDGQTLGKKACKIKVVSADGSDITSSQAWTRAITRSGLGIVLCIGPVADYLAGVFTNERTAIHDMTAKTRVVKWG